MKMASIGILVMPLTVLVGTAIGVLAPGGTATIHNTTPAAHGFSGSVVRLLISREQQWQRLARGWARNTLFYNTALGIAMLIGCYRIS